MTRRQRRLAVEAALICTAGIGQLVLTLTDHVSIWTALVAGGIVVWACYRLPEMWRNARGQR